MDPISATFMSFGVVLLLVSWVYLMIISFREDFTWGLFTVLFPPLSYLYGCFAWSKAREALLVAGGGILLVIIALLA